MYCANARNFLLMILEKLDSAWFKLNGQNDLEARFTGNAHTHMGTHRHTRQTHRTYWPRFVSHFQSRAGWGLLHPKPARQKDENKFMP